MRIRPLLLLIIASVAVPVIVACTAPPPAPPAPTDGGTIPVELRSDPFACFGCHRDDYVKTPHHQGERSTTCGVCHVETDWKTETLKHDFWPLTGAHLKAKAKCTYCHAHDEFRGTKNACMSCHLPEFEGAPYHDVNDHPPARCAECHGTTAWKPALVEVPKAIAKEPEPEPEPEPVKPVPSAKPKPKPKPKPPPTPTETVKPPDIVTRPSRRH